MQRDRGSVTLGFALVVVVMMFAVGVSLVGSAAISYATAATAADAAALAAAPVTFRPFGASGSARSEAARFARSNGAVLVVCRCPMDRSWRKRTVTITVAHTVRLPIIGPTTTHATSRATFDPSALIGPAGPLR